MYVWLQICYIFLMETKESIKSINCNHKVNQYWWNWPERKREIYIYATAAYLLLSVNIGTCNVFGTGCSQSYLSTFYNSGIAMCNTLPLTRCDRFNGVINAHTRIFVPSSVGLILFNARRSRRYLTTRIRDGCDAAIRDFRRRIFRIFSLARETLIA